ncbi:fimbrial protein [uncultured Porphyromonas sp.]|uniref:fimbrial tip adhesin FimD n=1 Tax=uncultured Porphyromonas sp. TaxID=159274 RepID=UPI0026153EE4|nr:fimbrial protein [uncultured Porphyromonas sp.]
MNRLIDISTRLVGYALILLMVSGCVTERPVACPDEGSTAELSLRLAVQEIRSLRATTEPGVDALNENKIESLQILFYKEGTLYWSVSPAPAADGNYIIPIPEAQRQGFDGSSTYNVYVVTNMTFTAPQQESDLAKIVVTESIADKPNAKFVMQGKTSKQINLKTPEGKQLGAVELHRVASKLRITPTVAVEGYALDGTIQIKFVGATDRGCLIAEEAATGVSAIDYGYRDTQDQQPQLFYSYYSNWSSDPDLAPYYLLTVPLKKAGETTVINNYYRVALTPAESHFTANKLYDLTLGIHKLGSTTPEEPVSITGSLSILPWTICDDQYDLPAANYLEVSEREAHIYNVETHTISYESSKKPVTIRIVEVSFSYVNGATGEAITEAIPNSSDQYPSVTVVGNHIQIESRIPINNVPKKIRFKVSNGITELDKEVTVYQYPSHFITHTNGAKSSRRPNGRLADGLNNKAIYRITVQNPPKDMILGFPPRETTDFWPGYWNGSRWVLNGGNKTSKLTTKRDAETAQMVSPSFELASQLGATERWPYLEYGWTEGGSWFNPTWSRTNKIGAFEETALCDCALYTETRIVDGQEVTLDDWRLPTEAEIRLIDQLQNDPNSAVKAIMTGAYYWSAKSDAAIELQGGSEGSTSRAYTRCVRDVKDPTIQSHIPYRLDR